MLVSPLPSLPQSLPAVRPKPTSSTEPKLLEQYTVTPLLSSPHETKTIDFGSSGRAASLSKAGRVLSLHVPHAARNVGMVNVVPYAQYPADRFYDSEHVRSYRALPLKLLDDRIAGFGFAFDQVQHVSWDYIEAAWPMATATTADGLVICSVYTVDETGNFVQSVWTSAPSNVKTAAKLNFKVGGSVSVNRAPYTQLTEAGPVPMPKGENLLTLRDGVVEVRNPNLPAVFRAALSLDGGNTSVLSNVTDQHTTDEAVTFWSEHCLALKPGETKTLQLTMSVNAESSTLSPISPVSPFKAIESVSGLRLDALRDLLHRKGASEETTKTLAYAVARNLVYLTGPCSMPNGCIITDHMCLPLGWNRDNYFQLALVSAFLNHLPRLVKSTHQTQWQTKLERILRAHLEWVFQTADRPKGFWGRSYIQTGRLKDLVFQLDQQCYPLLELADHVLARENDKDTLMFAASIVNSGVPDEILDCMESNRWDQQEGADVWLFKTAETPGDDEVEFPYHLSSHILLWRTLERFRKMTGHLKQSGLDVKMRHNLSDWATGVHRDTLRHFIVPNPAGDGTIFAYLTSATLDAEAQTTLYHDANDLPTALAARWGFCSSDDETWLNTIRFGFSTRNTEGYYGADARYGGLGSVHTRAPWPLGDAQRLVIDANDVAASDKLARIVQWDGLFSEAIDADTAKVVSKHWFCWPGCFIATVLLQNALDK